MDQEVFQRLRTLIQGESGIFLTEEKRQLLSNRLRKRLRTLKLSNEREYLELLERDKDRVELNNLLNAISTNVTYFGREFEHFEHFGRILKGMTDRKKIRVWCAASSTGEEPYTLAMVARENLKLTAEVDFKILATDINTEVLIHAQRGLYRAANAEKLPDAWRAKYLNAANNGADVSVVPELQELIAFRRLNLAKLPTPLKGPIDVIFCRNVMIYFDLALRTQLVAEFYRLLGRGGYLFLSQSENLLGIQHKFKGLGLSCYQKTDA